jgi:hypothetical protein
MKPIAVRLSPAQAQASSGRTKQGSAASPVDSLLLAKGYQTDAAGRCDPVCRPPEVPRPKADRGGGEIAEHEQRRKKSLVANQLLSP